MPNENLSPPVDNKPAEETELRPDVLQIHYPNLGNGYVAGSSPQARDDANAAKVSGVKLTVPLQQ